MNKTQQRPTSVRYEKLSSEQIQSLRHANEVLSIEYVCLSRIREPLGLVGGYWNMDQDIIFKVSAGSLDIVVNGIEQMRAFFAHIHNALEISSEINTDIKRFIDQAGIWVKVNRIYYY
ncbi:hypothetical protein GGI25_004994 [Coemansia spiralis]|uniref:Uncharacterized protein n=2 Tax=Coemansia TaxID=4863 RepID=A0A9W8KW44_9FUNG|nr:hypothetical protein EDC05_004847 [Coemansia umbellata]KAJ2620145.1 hypothetical protein GGI26_005260 [Coemansia sp. RSA 1358]KAJ2672676.1 hypothetical protein GGI25_004994 [Coemansia spiralis]